MEEKERFDIDKELNRLEEINRQLAQEGISLDESIRLYNEGTILAAKCKEHLTGVEKELQIINSEQ
ncbi:MAG: exodeoxyribonuclease VII small subunit [Parasporobacterium sp.]|nr:exodeoxyribonuclease VII small subunit [Parasporobacterium sp.]